MTQKGYNVPGWTCDKLPHSCQQDGSSCGPFVLKVSEMDHKAIYEFFSVV